MSGRDPVRRFLAERGVPAGMVAAGLPGLIAEWERTVAQIETGYPLGLDDYLNDLDGRQLLAEAVALAAADERPPATERIGRADARARAHLRAVGECLWGARVAEYEGWTPEVNWWYFAVPRSPGPLLREDLGARS
ncbi:MAG: hypothetical protein E6K81_00835 [Candidatus Eisenbacteria bacterium]|uniref:Uncharacterized protein n=1 Tax=Eiseniibacteriota bacterium TaxID=2212470 RepID=A0A538UE40_UNCEI|nr:MAG: hypothetical protein E6K81_00835 [Candidatus Eisenbacteria bacterium]